MIRPDSPQNDVSLEEAQVLRCGKSELQLAKAGGLEHSHRRLHHDPWTVGIKVCENMDATMYHQILGINRLTK